MSAERLGLLLAGLACLALAAMLPDAAAQAPTGGPDLAGYTWIDSTAAGGPTLAFVDISGNGTVLSGMANTNDLVVNLPFAFPWYDIWTSQARIGSNGLVCLLASSSCTSSAATIGSSFTPNYVILAYNKDLLCQSNQPCAWTHSWGPPGSQVFAIMFETQFCSPQTAVCNLNYEVKLFEATGCAEVHYGNILDTETDTVRTGVEGRTTGGTYTGLNYWTGTTPQANLNGKAVRYCPGSPPPPPPANVSPCGYTVSSPPYSFTDISGTGTAVPHTGTGTDIDVGLWASNLSLYFCGSWYSSMRLSSEGYMCFGTTSSCTSGTVSTIPTTTDPDGAVFGYWTDYNFAPCASSGVPCAYWEILGAAPNRVFIYQFQAAPLEISSVPQTFQFKVFESDMCIEVHYQSVGGGNERVLAGYESPSGLEGYTWRDQVPGWSASNEAVRYCPPQPVPPQPPPPCGYTVSSPPYDFVDITATGTGVPHTATSAIDLVVPDFAFPFCGQSFRTFRLSSEGYICFGDPSGPAPTACTSTTGTLPSPFSPNNAIYGYWSSFTPSSCAGGSTACVKWQLMGSAPNRVFVYMFNAVPYSTGGGSATFEIKLFEADGCMEVHYNNVVGPATARAVAGYETQGGTDAYIWRDSTPGWPTGQEAVRYCPPTPLPPPPTVACGYTVSHPPIDFVDITATGTGLPHTTSTQFDITPGDGFDIGLCGQAYGTFRLSPRGLVCLGRASGPAPSTCTSSFPAVIPTTTVPNAAVFGYWSALNPPGCIGGSIACTKWELQGTAPNRVLIYMFKDVPFSSGGNQATFQFKFFEADDCIEVHYLDVEPAPARAVAGFEAAGGTSGYAWRDQTSGWAASNEAIRYCPSSVTASPLPACSYPISPIPVDFTDITATGTGVVLSDNSASTMALPWTHTHCGNNYGSVQMSSNGYLCFAGVCTSQSSNVIPTWTSPNAAIFAYWTDLRPDQCTGGSAACLKREIQGSPGNRVAIHQWKDVPVNNGGGARVTMQAKIFEATGCVEVHYQSVTGGPSLRAVAGFENAFGSAGGIYRDTVPGFVEAGTAWAMGPSCGLGLDEYTLNEDSPTSTLTVLDNDGGTGLTVVGVSAGSLGTTALAPGGAAITYEPLPHRNGLDTFNYLVQDSFGFVRQGEVRITLTAVNDEPFATPGTPVQGVQGGTAVVVPGWATGVEPAVATATDEATQAITFVPAGLSNGAIFSVPPTLERTASATSTVPSPLSGTFAMLSFTPSGVAGTSTACFQAQDDGGSATSTSVGVVPVHSATGDDLSPILCGTIEVLPCAPAVDAYDAYRWWTLRAASPGVLGNDVAGAPAAMEAPPLQGTVTMDPNGSFRYRPNDDFSGTTDQFTYRATCSGLPSSETTVTVTVRTNQPPVADFTSSADASTMEQTVSFQELCSDPDALVAGAPAAMSSLTWRWEFGDGTTSSEPYPSHTYAEPGSYLVRLTVTDGVGNASAIERWITVSWPRSPAADEGLGGAAAPVADAGPDRRVSEGARVTLSGRVLGASSGSFQWQQVSGPTVALRNASTPHLSFDAPATVEAATDLAFSLRVTAGGATSAPDVVVVRVVPGNQPPSAVARGPASVLVGASATLDGSGSFDPENGNLTYLWESLTPGVELQDATSAKPAFTAPAAPGVLQFRLTVFDGRTSGQDVLLVRVEPAAAPVQATAGPALTDDTAPGDTDAPVSGRLQRTAEPASTWPWLVVGGAFVAALVGVALLAFLRRR